MEAENWRGKVYGKETSGLSAVNAKFLQQSNNVFRGQTFWLGIDFTLLSLYLLPKRHCKGKVRIIH